MSFTIKHMLSKWALRREGKTVVDEQIEKKAKLIIIENGFDQVIPFDPIPLAKKSGIEVKNASFADAEIAGVIKKQAGRTTILVNHADSYNRKRFTIAHELGHFFLHLAGQDDTGFIDMYRTINGRGNKSQLETEANAFAAAILMDDIMVKSLWTDLSSVQSLAEIFGVSYEAMGYRLSNLGLL